MNLKSDLKIELIIIALVCISGIPVAWAADDSDQSKGYTQEKPETGHEEITSKITDDNTNKKKPEVKDKVKTVFKEMVVTEEIEKDSHFTSPSTRIKREQVELQNAQTTEEVLKFQPSLQIRQRYVGDPNGVLGIRGADMFSTARNMVFADGLPIHNHLQSTFNGAPRWSLVGPNEIDVVDVVYGPFSAEYSSNSIGGVINLKTRMPRKQEFYVESSLFIQPYKNYGPDKGTFIGDRQYVSYGNRFFDKLSVFAAYNRLEAQSHPMSYFIDNTGLNSPGGTPAPVTGGIREIDARGTPSIVYGDTGPEKVVTDLTKFKLGYDLTPGLQAIFTAAYENRTRKSNKPRNYLTSIATGQPFFGGGALPNAVTPDGTTFDVAQRGFGINEDVRQTLQLGLNLHGALTNNWFIDTTTSHFNVLKDTRATSFFNPSDPANLNTGQIQDFKQFDWFNHDLKLSTPALFGYGKLGFLGGYHFDQYKLKFKQYSLSDYGSMIRGPEQLNSANQGQTSTHAFFAQTTFRFLPKWDITTGIRQEFWSATDGMVSGVAVPDRHLSPTTPKVSLGYEPGRWKFRYSFGRTHRFPVISELYQSLASPTSITTANALLKPENGLHHNFMIEYEIPKGYVRVNVFRDDIKDAIQSVQTVAGILSQRAFQNIGTTSTTGVELIFDQRRILGSKFDYMLNFTWMNAQVENGPIVNYVDPTGTANAVNLSGKQIIRLPHYRLNFFTTYHATPAWDLSLGGRYTSDSFNDLDNGDVGKQHVFGAQSDFFFLDFKTNYRYQFESGIKSRYSFGITNLNDMQAYVFHPYPQRTFLLEVAFSY
ncbi:MAG: TonB-dependent receptor [Nitrosomonadales bacterium]|nr:MAG: TonB-dependent receptor [Nitrosomonadales bacterium]